MLICAFGGGGGQGEKENEYDITRFIFNQVFNSSVRPRSKSKKINLRQNNLAPVVFTEFLGDKLYIHYFFIGRIYLTKVRHIRRYM